MRGRRGYRPRTLYQLDRKDAEGRHGDRYAVARLGRHGGLCGTHDGQDVGRRVPAHHDCTGIGAGYADYPTSTHELDIALSLTDAIALIDPPCLSCLPTEEMRRSGCIERLFRNNSVTFDTATGSIKVKQ